MKALSLLSAYAIFANPLTKYTVQTIYFVYVRFAYALSGYIRFHKLLVFLGVFRVS